MTSITEFLKTDVVLSNWFAPGVITGIVVLIIAEIIGIIRSQKNRRENFYLFRPAVKLGGDDYDILLGQKNPPRYLQRELGGRIFENGIIEKMEPGAKLLLTGKAGIGKTHMVIRCAKKFRRHYLALPKPEKIQSLKLPRRWGVSRWKVVLFLDDLQYFSSPGTRLPYLLSSVARQSRDLRVVATCRTEEVEKIPEEDRRLFTRVEIPEWTDEEGNRLASVIDRQEAYQKYFDGTPASIVSNLYKRRRYYYELVNRKSSSCLILESLKLLLVAGIHSKLQPAKMTLVRQVSEGIFGYQGPFQLDIEELERKEFINRLETRVSCLEKYLLDVVRDPPRWSSKDLQTYLGHLHKVLTEKGYTRELLPFGTALYRMGSLERSINAFTAYLGRNPSDPVAYNIRGVAHHGKREYDLAIEDHTEAIRLSPNFAAAYNNRGNAYDDKGEYDLAIDDYTQAIKIEPTYARGYYNRGVAYHIKGEYDLAIDDYTQAIKIEPTYGSAYGNRGVAWGQKGEHELAVEDCTQAIKIDPNKADAYANRANAYYERGEHDLAIGDYMQTIRIDRTWGRKIADRGLQSLTTGSLDAAVFYLKNVLGYRGKISNSPEFRRRLRAQLNSLVARILKKQR